jgi:hypothetical protein
VGCGDGSAVADGLGGVFVGVCGRVVGAVDLSEYVSLASGWGDGGREEGGGGRGVRSSWRS